MRLNKNIYIIIETLLFELHLNFGLHIFNIFSTSKGPPHGLAGFGTPYLADRIFYFTFQKAALSLTHKIFNS